MKTYALYCNGELALAKPFYVRPVSPTDFGVAGIPTSCYDICEVETRPVGDSMTIPATIDVGSKGLCGG